MTIADRIELGAADPSVVVAAEGLLAEFNDAGVLAPLDVLAAQTVGRMIGESDPQVLLAAALAVRGTRYGHVCVTLDGLRDAVVVDGQAPEIIDSLSWPDPAGWRSLVAASALVGAGVGDEPLVLIDDRLYLERYFRYEEQVAALVLNRLGRSGMPPGPKATAMLAALLGDETSRQHDAAILGLTAKVSVIIGGPGTGKTHTVGAMLAALAAERRDDFPLVGVCAPTGKAAARLGEAIGELAEQIGDESIRSTLRDVKPSTIHRLLGWSWGRSQFRHSAAQRLPHDLVIVDEMSMVSLPLAAKLLAAVRDDAAVVLVGDPFQLESIEAGTVLADIVGPKLADPVVAGDTAISDCITVLDRVHRFEADSAIADFADAVRTGHADSAVELLSKASEHLRWVRDRHDPAFAELWAAVVDQRRRMVELARDPSANGAAIGALGEMAVLCAHRRGPESVREWGRELEAALDGTFAGLRWGDEWYPGRPIMVTRNDYALELYNGDIGMAVETDAGMRVAFERGGEIRTYPLTQLGEYATVHAMTIHKSQGSQFDEVVVVLPSEASRLLTRELLYTAVTRAKTRVWVVGAEVPVRAAVSRSVQRASGLGERLWQLRGSANVGRQ